MDIQSFSARYAQTLDDGWLNNNQRDGVVIGKDVEECLARGEFDADPEAKNFATQLLSNRKSSDIIAMWDVSVENLRPQDIAASRDFQRFMREAPLPEPVPAPEPGLGTQLGGADTAPKINSEQAHVYSLRSADTSQLNANLAQTSAHTMDTYDVPGLSQRKGELIQAANELGASREETGWLIAHGMIESQEMIGPNDTSKPGNARCVGIFNMNLGMAREISDHIFEQTRERIDPDNMSLKQSAQLMLEGLHLHGFEKMEALIRGGSTGAADLAAGFSQDTYGVQSWMEDVRRITSATLNNEALFSGDARGLGNIPAV